MFVYNNQYLYMILYSYMCICDFLVKICMKRLQQTFVEMGLKTKQKELNDYSDAGLQILSTEAMRIASRRQITISIGNTYTNTICRHTQSHQSMNSKPNFMSSLESTIGHKYVFLQTHMHTEKCVVTYYRS